jgi:hypothetical protein
MQDVIAGVIIGFFLGNTTKPILVETSENTYTHIRQPDLILKNEIACPVDTNPLFATRLDMSGHTYWVFTGCK